MHRHNSHAPAAQNAWKAATTRLTELLDMYDAFDGETKLVVAEELPKNKRVVQSNPGKTSLRDRAFPFTKLCQEVYERSTWDFEGPGIQSGRSQNGQGHGTC